ncbi:SLAP domain-containing protein [Lactobacillus hamsteri]|uniref:Surface layer protein n=1 Tax=Lactobacillus hamsteri DSM 5661 = JCM 6256 TaxID=1423754 RepID=A0A0R1YCJ3_9LACO|nr:SLAP domain-containing protein [Lactobacillus hamsteri]KRM40109.1 surface layer protein [Lactobacillus hamsteri DSM 5661 = JCM 6256]
MNLKKITICSVALTLAVAPVISNVNNIDSASTMTVKAATSQQGKIKLVKNIDYTGSALPIPVYNSNGKEITNYKKINGDTTLKFYGKPVILKGQKYNIENPFPPVTINGSNYVSLGDNGYIKQKNLGSFNPKTETVSLVRNSYVYDVNGKRLKSYRSGKAYIKAHTPFRYVGKTSYYLPQAYFRIGTNAYIRASYVSQMNGKSILTLNSNTYIYDKNGKRIKNFNGQSKLLKESVVTTTSKVRDATSSSQYYFYKNNKNSSTAKSTFATKKIKGQDYFAIGNGGYIKAANVITANGMILFNKGPITVTLPRQLTIYNSKFKETSKILKAGTKVKLSKTIYDNSLSDPQLYFKISGKDQYLYWGDAGEYPDRAANYDPNYNQGYSFSFRQFME